MMKKSRKFVRMAFLLLFSLGVLSLAGCGREEDVGKQANTAVQNEIPEEQLQSPEEQSQRPEEQTEPETARTQDTYQEQDAVQEQEAETGSIMRAYSDKERERMAELRQSYDNGTAKPEKKIQEVDSTEAVTEGTLCYIRSTGEYYLPDRELTDEELLEIIDCNVRIAVNSQGWTQEKIDEANRRDRAELEAKIKAAGGISEEEAIEIARKAMEADVVEKAGELELFISSDYERYGWKADLYEDDGVVYYSVNFINKELEMVDPQDYFSYNCSINAVDGSIYSACSISGDVIYPEPDDFVWYEH